ncbi:unnamed protein product [Rotaria sordida]|uniref:G-protein coupled receptors family 1 profile domain-containing protein n=1 Tax=Rotaria sordida TaxID=392033 RepID=A0A818Y537_9BILA|nr:unnamed protein product [Rotaria sordida]CAF0898632.1 unnamed protein product [Rotaria sordida]CAF1104856.1 unnamed protein product [Rotaria sordida]CAF1150328.1 unnamed protein product [Rotaria sordida]CAF1315946.1 unnamed protein product [Rotaria sordida]
MCKLSMAYVLIAIDWICVILFILGFIGNLLGLIVFSSRRFRCCSTYASLALASFSINLICVIRYTLLLHSTTRRWLSDNFVGIHWLTCKIFRLSSSFRVLAAWITVFWVIERFVYVTSRLHLLYNRDEKFHFLKKYKYLCMIIIALIMVIIVSGPTVIFFAPNLANLNTTQSSIYCTYDNQHVSSMWQHYFDDLSFGFNYHTVRCLFSELIPSLLVALFNIGIIACILRTTAHVRRRQQYNHINHLSIPIITGSITKMPATSPLYLYDRSQQLQRQSSSRQTSLRGSTNSTRHVPFGKMSWMNIVLLLHSLLFFLSSSITSLIFFSTSNLILAHWVSVIILANCSLNFYVYCLSGRLFRKELKRIAKRYIRHIHKAIRRTPYSHDRRRSPIQNGQNNNCQPIYQIKQRNYTGAQCVRSYPVHQIMKQKE